MEQLGQPKIGFSMDVIQLFPFPIIIGDIKKLCPNQIR